MSRKISPKKRNRMVEVARQFCGPSAPALLIESAVDAAINDYNNGPEPAKDLGTAETDTPFQSWLSLGRK